LGQNFGPIFKGKESTEDYIFTLKEGTDNLSRKVGKKLPLNDTKNPEERSSQENAKFIPAL
jgi:hypothetical protein